MKLLYDRPIKRNRSNVEQLGLWQELLDIESWLRRKAEELDHDPRLAARLDRGADEVERAANRIHDHIIQDTPEESK